MNWGRDACGNRGSSPFFSMPDNILRRCSSDVLRESSLFRNERRNRSRGNHLWIRGEQCHVLGILHSHVSQASVKTQSPLFSPILLEGLPHFCTKHICSKSLSLASSVFEKIPVIARAPLSLLPHHSWHPSLHPLVVTYHQYLSSTCFLGNGMVSPSLIRTWTSLHIPTIFPSFVSRPWYFRDRP